MIIYFLAFKGLLYSEMDEKEYLNIIGQNIKKIRLSKEISQIDFAHRCGFENSNLNRIEAGKNNLTVKTLLKIAEKLEVSLHDLLPK